jgi:hypothetical protein
MGYDITFHPIKLNEMYKYYYNLISAPETIDEVLKDVSFASKIRDIYGYGVNTDAKTHKFNKTHGFFVATIAGYLHEYWYVRGASISFLADKEKNFLKYFSDYESILPSYVKTMECTSLITENYMCGGFIEMDKLPELKNDLNSFKFKAVVEEVFSHGRLKIINLAIDYALKNKTGILEATDLVVPNPFDIDKVECITNLSNCHVDGALLYQKAVSEQIEY